MKFKARKESTGNWFINTHKKNGTQYGQRFENELEAKQQAALKTMYHHYDEMNKAWNELCKISQQNSYGEIKIIGRNSYSNQGDFLC